MKSKLAITFAFFLLVASHVANAQARDQINAVGSSTVYPFTTTVAEQFGRAGKFKTPKVESTGTGGGIKMFCNGVGPQFPDVANASRPMKKGEFDTCVKNGVKDIVEINIGYDGLTISASKKGKIEGLTRKEVYLALAKQVPNPSNPTELIANPYKTWNQINSSLPSIKIEVLGPPPTSGTRDSFVELFMEPGCQQYSWIKDLKETDEKGYKKICHTIREDGAYIEAGENDNLIAQKLAMNSNALGIFGYSFLEENTDKLKGLKIDGITPSFETIASNKYPTARPLFVYVKKAHIGVIPGLKEFMVEYVSDKAIGEEGYLTDRGLVALEKSELTKVRNDVYNMKNFKP